VVRRSEKRGAMANPEPLPKDDDAFADRRVYPRVTVALPASLLADGVRHSIQLLDVSAGGAKLNCSASLAAGTAVMLDCGTLARSAVVRWQNGGIMGVKFDSELDERVVTALIDRSTALGALMKSRE
jgi:PilZ domain